MAELEVRVAGEEPARVSAALLVLQHFEGDTTPRGATRAVDEVLGGAIGRALRAGDFRGRRDETQLFYGAGEGPARVLLVGVGKREEFSLRTLRRAVGVAVGRARALGVPELTLSLSHARGLGEDLAGANVARGAVDAAVLASWRFRELKTLPDEEDGARALERVVLLASDDAEREAFQRGAHYGLVLGRAENRARDLATRPGNVATPSYLAEQARALGASVGFDVTVLDEQAVRTEGMNALLAVARGSQEPPRFIVMEYRGGLEGAPPVALVGKGVTFDAGGISLKPAEKMEEMKYDMGGGAAVIAAMGAIAELRLPVNVVGLVPSTENLPSGTATKPGDVIHSHLGKTIEVVNTDAEGRLILADALSYARRFSPAAMVDAATLTGSVIIALGHHAIGLMGNDGALIDEVREAGRRVDERCWPLPLWDEYRKQLDSDVADIKNVGGRPAGSITAAWFLREFAGDIPWAHLDVAGTAWGDELDPPLRKGATGIPTRLFVEWVRARSEH